MPNVVTTCRETGCSRKANGGRRYCARHYRAWRRGSLPKGRYKTCRVEACRKRIVGRGRCEEHFARDYPGKRPAAAAGTVGAASGA